MKTPRKIILLALSCGLIQLLPGLGTSKPSNAAEITYTYTACYFRSGNSETWRWGLKANDAWYEMAGTWEKRRHIKTTYFKPNNATRQAIIQSCLNSKSYYGEAGRLIGVYAADSSVGNNYQIRLNSGNRIDGIEVLP